MKLTKKQEIIFEWQNELDTYVEIQENKRKSILKNYPQYVENILFKSIQKMKKASEEKIIDYALLKCRL